MVKIKGKPVNDENNQNERAHSVNLTDAGEKKRLRFNGAAEGKNEQFSVSITGDILFLQKSRLRAGGRGDDRRSFINQAACQ
jgi:hypothetical protein